MTGALPGIVATLTWFWALAAFIVVEGIEVARALVRKRAYGWKRRLLVYLPSKWSRDFTFGMFYAFTLQLEKSSVQVPPWTTAPAQAIVAHGPYIVLAFLLTETFVFLREGIRSGPRAAKPAA